MSSVPLGASTGAVFGATCPGICTVAAAGNPGAEAGARIVTWEDVLRGVHVPEYKPFGASTTAKASGGSPFVKVATTCASPTGFPHVSTRVIDSGVAHEAGLDKLLTRPVCVGTS